MKDTCYNRLFTDGVIKTSKQFWVLLDPDRDSPAQLRDAAELAVDNGADALLVGSSYYERNDFDASVQAVREGSNSAVPIMLFPGDHRQLSAYADALLFLNLLSGRNAQYLVGEQMLAAPRVRNMGLETIPVGYILVESGRVTSVQSVTGTSPIPRDKPELIASHALAGQYLGHKVIYLEAGSGAKWRVPDEAISLTRHTVEIPLIVGGGLRTPENARDAAEAGADVIVVGTALEQRRERELMIDMAEAVHNANGKTRHVNVDDLLKQVFGDD